MNISHKENDILNPFGNKGNTPNLEALLRSPTDILSPASLSYGSPKPGTSRVIDALQTTIDTLKAEILDLKSKYEDEKSKSLQSKKKYDQALEQLATAKHENDMNSALLERKQRRVADLENKLNDQISSSEDYKYNLDKLETRCKKLSESEKIANSEFERMKIAYETLVTSQKQYKDYCSKEIEGLRNQLESFIDERNESLRETNVKIDDNNIDIENNLDNLNESLHAVENQYFEKNSLLVSTLKSLTLAAKSHGQDTQLVINQCNLVFNELKNQFNLDVNKLIENYKDTHIDNTIEKLLNIEPITSPKNEYNPIRNSRRISSYNIADKRRSVSGVNNLTQNQTTKKSNNFKRQSMVDFSEFTNNNNNNSNTRNNNKQKRNSSYSTPNTPLLNNNNNGNNSSFGTGNNSINGFGNSSFNNGYNDSFNEIIESGSESEADVSNASLNNQEKKKKNRRRRRRGGANRNNNNNNSKAQIENGE